MLKKISDFCRPANGVIFIYAFMGITFGLIVLVLLLAGLYYQRKKNKTWVAEERYEESGDWIDKRSGERGTFGSLDAEREHERKSLVQQGQINELARLLRAYCFEQYPGFNDLSDVQIKSFTNFARSQAKQWLKHIESYLNRQPPTLPTPEADNAHALALKKIILDFSYTHFPKLLNLELEQLQDVDQLAASIAAAHLKEIEALRR